MCETHLCSVSVCEDYLEGLLSPLEESDFLNHLDRCSECGDRLSEIAAGLVEWKEAAQFLVDDEFDDRELNSRLEGADELARDIFDLSFLNPSDNPNMLGRIGSYEVSGIVGNGGMGLVLKACDPALDRVVAIKVLARHLATNQSARSRFAREARAVATVSHPNVISIFGVDEQNGLPYFVTPYLSGGSLQKSIDKGRQFTITEVVQIGQQIAAGLSAAHANGIVHRDIKPSNLMLEVGVRVTITDFGLARAVDDVSMTQSGALVGTPSFMSPEQGRGDQVDYRSDLFSLGSVLYMMCTGVPPFRASSSFAVVQRIQFEQPKEVSQLNPSVPDWFARLVERLHEKDPRRRIQSSSELQQVLGQCLRHLEHPELHAIPITLRRSLDSHVAKPVIRFSAVVLATVAFFALPFCKNSGFQGSSKGASDEASRKPGHRQDSKTNQSLEYLVGSDRSNSSNSIDKELEQLRIELDDLDQRTSFPYP